MFLWARGPRDHEKTKILVVFLWSRGPRDHENQKNAWAWDGDLTKRPREDQNSRGVLVVSWSNFLSKPKCHLVVLVVLVVLWTTRPREPQEPKECLGWRFNQEDTVPVLSTRSQKISWLLVVFSWAHGPQDHKNQKMALGSYRKLYKATTRTPQEFWSSRGLLVKSPSQAQAFF